MPTPKYFCMKLKKKTQNRGKPVLFTQPSCFFCVFKFSGDVLQLLKHGKYRDWVISLLSMAHEMIYDGFLETTTEYQAVQPVE